MLRTLLLTMAAASASKNTNEINLGDDHPLKIYNSPESPIILDDKTTTDSPVAVDPSELMIFTGLNARYLLDTPQELNISKNESTHNNTADKVLGQMTWEDMLADPKVNRIISSVAGLSSTTQVLVIAISSALIYFAARADKNHYLPGIWKQAGRLIQAAKASGYCKSRNEQKGLAALEEAVKANDFAALKSILEATHVEGKEETGLTGIALAIKYGKKITLGWLEVIAKIMNKNSHRENLVNFLKALAIADTDPSKGNTALILAVEEGQTEIARRMIQITKPLLAHNHEDVRTAAIDLLKKGNVSGYTVVTSAAKFGDVKVFCDILNLGVEDNNKRNEKVEDQILNLLAQPTTGSETHVGMWLMGKCKVENRQKALRDLATPSERYEMFMSLVEFLRKMLTRDLKTLEAVLKFIDHKSKAKETMRDWAIDRMNAKNTSPQECALKAEMIYELDKLRRDVSLAIATKKVQAAESSLGEVKDELHKLNAAPVKVFEDIAEDVSVEEQTKIREEKVEELKRQIYWKRVDKANEEQNLKKLQDSPKPEKERVKSPKLKMAQVNLAELKDAINKSEEKKDEAKLKLDAAELKLAEAELKLAEADYKIREARSVLNEAEVKQVELNLAQPEFKSLNAGSMLDLLRKARAEEKQAEVAEVKQTVAQVELAGVEVEVCQAENRVVQAQREANVEIKPAEAEVNQARAELKVAQAELKKAEAKTEPETKTAEAELKLGKAEVKRTQLKLKIVNIGVKLDNPAIKLSEVKDDTLKNLIKSEEKLDLAEIKLATAELQRVQAEITLAEAELKQATAENRTERKQAVRTLRRFQSEVQETEAKIEVEVKQAETELRVAKAVFNLLKVEAKLAEAKAKMTALVDAKNQPEAEAAAIQTVAEIEVEVESAKHESNVAKTILSLLENKLKRAELKVDIAEDDVEIKQAETTKTTGATHPSPLVAMCMLSPHKLKPLTPSPTAVAIDVADTRNGYNRVR